MSTLEEVDFGPQAEAVQAILEHFPKLSRDERKRMDDLRDDAFWAAWAVAGDGRADRVGLGAALGALFGRLIGWNGGYSAYGAALAVLLRHTFTADERHHYEALTRPWVTVTGRPAHPEDVTPVPQCTPGVHCPNTEGGMTVARHGWERPNNSSLHSAGRPRDAVNREGD